MRSRAALGLLAGLLGGCGPTEDFSVGVKQSPAEVIAAIGDIDFSLEKERLGNFEVAITRPSDHEIVYTIPAYEFTKSKGESVIHLTLEPLDGGSTRIHAVVDVPAVRMLVGEPNKVLSEHKVEQELRTVLTRSASADKMHALLTAVAVASSTNLQSQVNTAQLDSENPGAVFWGIDPETGDERVPRYEAASADHDDPVDEAASDDWGVGTPD